jgi:hypothetical protein
METSFLVLAVTGIALQLLKRGGVELWILERRQ